VNPELEKKIDAVEADSAKKSERIESLLADFKNANPEAGKAVFESGKGTCIVCHRVGEIGGNVGPNLSTIGRIRSARDLFESVLYPNESIARDFNTYEVKRKNGQSSLLGLIESQTAAAIVVIDPAGQRREVPREDVVSLIEIPTSLMPPGLEQTLPPEELRDLVAWLLSLK
jgi:putative heme-binding domain-containing protein